MTYIVQTSARLSGSPTATYPSYFDDKVQAADYAQAKSKSTGKIYRLYEVGRSGRKRLLKSYNRKSLANPSHLGSWLPAKAVRVRTVGERKVIDIMTTSKAIHNPSQQKTFYGKKNAKAFAAGLKRQGVEDVKVKQDGGSLGASPYYTVYWYSSVR
jgi:hypothetical protein